MKNVAEEDKRHLDIVQKESEKDLHGFQEVDWLGAKGDEEVTR